MKQPVNIVGWVRTFVDVNFHSLPNSWQYSIVAAGSACVPILAQALNVLDSHGHFNLHQLAHQCVLAMLAAHVAQRLKPPMQPPPPIANQSTAPPDAK
jgi:hypothetical protein